MTARLRTLGRVISARRWRVLIGTTVALVIYQGVIAGILIVGLRGLPTYVRWYPAWTNARRIVASTPSWLDVVTVLAREPLLEYGRLHPAFRVAVWSYELTW